jgi:hypothetical protein
MVVTLFEVLSWYLPGGAEENNDKAEQSVSGINLKPTPA